MSFIKKTVSALLCAVLVASSVLVFAACGKNNNNNTENSTTKSNNANVTKVTVRYLNFKPEVADVYKKIADEYEKETGGGGRWTSKRGKIHPFQRPCGRYDFDCKRYSGCNA